ncbi:type IV secretory system conjugative DNA transfer family protein [Candidatus Gracilibacteria bacterium]|nr:type IV secretory system conjugative DNA transfer family protein [Candidatus Gracilibacteria bacterium]
MRQVKKKYNLLNNYESSSLISKKKIHARVMSGIMGIIFILIAFQSQSHAAIGRSIGQQPGGGGQRTQEEAGKEAADTGGGMFSNFGESFINFFYIVFQILILIVVCIAIVKILRLAFEIWYVKNLVRMRIMLPRSDSKLDKERETKKDFKEKIGQMNMFYKAVHKLSEAGLRETVLDFFFAHSKLSLELIYEKGEVSFFISTYDSFAPVVAQHITSIYNDAEISIVDKKDYVKLLRPGYKNHAASLGKSHKDYFPIRSYKYLEDDPINNFTNVFGGLEKDDTAIYQIVVKPVKSRWNTKALKAARNVAKGKYNKRRNFKNLGIILKPFSWLWNPLVAIVQGPDDMVGRNNAPGASEGDAYKIFNQAETEAQKIMGESSAQPAFETSISIIVSSKTKKQAQQSVKAIVAASSIFTDEYNNALDNPQILEDALAFIFTPIRMFAFRFKLVGLLQASDVFSTDEISTLFHLPDINYNRSPIISWLSYKKLSPPHNLKFPTEATMLEEKNTNGETKLVHRHLGGFPVFKDGILLGWNEYRNKKIPIYFNRKDRGRHQYIIGKSGGGKSVFIGYLARQDVWNGDGLCVIDPHGDLVEDVLSFIPKERAKDVIIFDPSDTERPMGLNMLDIISTDPDIRKREMDRAAMDATEIFIKIFGDEIFGPRIQHYFRNGCLTLMEDEEDGGTLIDVPRLFVDEAFMKYKTRKIKNPVVKSFWEHEYANTGDREKQEMIPYFSAKFGPFITNSTIRNIIGQPKSAFNLREVMDNKKILLVNLSKGKIGALNAQLLGLVFVSKINMAAMSRADIPEDQRKDFYLYVDEFQNFATETFGEILSEARKYRLALIMAHQFIAQIGGSGAKKGDKPSIKDAVFGNAGTISSFKVGADDAEYLEKEYAPLLSQQDIIGIANFTTYTKLNIDNSTTRPFDLKTIWDNNYQNRKAAEILREYSRKKYGRKKKYVDIEIEARLGIMNNS